MCGLEQDGEMQICHHCREARCSEERGQWGGLGEKQVKTSQWGRLRWRGQKGGEPRLSNGDYTVRGFQKSRVFDSVASEEVY